MTAWFDVDRAGLAKLLERRGKSFIISELLQNAWDEPGVTQVDVRLEREPRSPNVCLTVTDDAPDGFADLAHAYTIFAESKKKADPTKRGRFNMGEKMILALAVEARIVSTKGGWEFNRDGRHRLRKTRERGSLIQIILPMKASEVDECAEHVRKLIVPAGILTTFNNERLSEREVAFSTEDTIATEIADAEGYLRPSRRKTRIDLLRTADGEEGWLYEMGIPVVPTGDTYHVNVHQKVPLNMERDNVPPAFLKSVRTIAFNLAHGELNEETANSEWARVAMADPNASEDAIRSAFTARFGEKVVAFDPNDAEANKRAVAEGYAVVHLRNLRKEEWGNVNRVNLAPRAGLVTPSPKLYGDGPMVRTIPEDKWTPGMHALAALTRAIGKACAEVQGVGIVYEVEPTQPYSANYGGGRMVFNLGRLGKKWPDQGVTESTLDLILHEFGHEESCDHLSSAYYHALTKYGARLALRAAADPAFLRWDTYLPAAGGAT